MQRIQRTGAGISILFLLCTLLVGCKGPLEMTITGTPSMNEGNAAMVRVYQLTSRTGFDSAQREDLILNPEETLGADIVWRDQFRLFPDSVLTLPIDLEKNTEFLAIVADLRKPIDEGWRRSYQVSEVKGKKVRVMVLEGTINVIIQ